MISVAEVFADANCQDHPLGVAPAILDGAETIVGLARCGCTKWNSDGNTCGTYCDTSSFAVAELSDGRVIVVWESSDSTGHGCQCSGSADLFESLSDALWQGLDREDREAALVHLSAIPVSERSSAATRLLIASAISPP